MIDLEQHLDDRVTRRRLKLEARRARGSLAIIVCGAIAGLACAAYIASQISPTLLAKSYEASFAVDDARAVVPGRHRVQIRGIEAGTITKVRWRGTQPVLVARIRKSYGPIYRDARAVLRPRTPLQDMDLDIVDRGTPAAGRISRDEPLAAARTTTSVNVSDVMNAFSPDVRGHFRSLLAELGRGLDDRGVALGQVFAQAVPFVQAAGRLTGQLGRRADLTERLVHNAGLLTEELGRRDAQLRRLVRSGGNTLSAIESRGPALEATLRELPPTLTEARASFAALRGVLGAVDESVAALTPVAAELPDALRSARRLNVVARPAVHGLREPVRRLLPLTRSLRPAASSLADALHALLPQIPAYDKLVKGVAGCKRGLQGFFQWDASIGKFSDVRGPAPRGNFEISFNSAINRDPLAIAPKSCTPGSPISGRPPTSRDMR